MEDRARDWNEKQGRDPGGEDRNQPAVGNVQVLESRLGHGWFEIVRWPISFSGHSGRERDARDGRYVDSSAGRPKW